MHFKRTNISLSFYVVLVCIAPVLCSYAQTPSLPSCGATCMFSAASATITCSASDLSCLCTNADYVDQATQCLQEGCSSADAKKAMEYLEYGCSQVGVTIPQSREQV